jgi:hypothetical protein
MPPSDPATRTAGANEVGPAPSVAGRSWVYGGGGGLGAGLAAGVVAIRLVVART